jgi:hypothetical protein
MISDALRVRSRRLQDNRETGGIGGLRESVAAGACGLRIHSRDIGIAQDDLPEHALKTLHLLR